MVFLEGNLLHREGAYRISIIFGNERPDYRFPRNSTDGIRRRVSEISEPIPLIRMVLVPGGTKPA